ncbi:MAG: GNAT family N-acetyltransferase [Sphingobacteriaceae bacterium]
MTTIKVAKSDAEINSCWHAMFQLRPHLKQEDFLTQIKAMQREGYTLLYLTDGDKTVSVAGYRIYSLLYSGKMLYIDDLSTLENCRKCGYASMLLQYIYQIAASDNCISVQLDSGPARTAAHKLYFKEDFIISAYHFHKKIGK